MCSSRTANQFTSAVKVFKGGEEPGRPGKSVMQLIILAAVEGTPMRTKPTAKTRKTAVAKLAGLFETGLLGKTTERTTGPWRSKGHGALGW